MTPEALVLREVKISELVRDTPIRVPNDLMAMLGLLARDGLLNSSQIETVKAGVSFLDIHVYVAHFVHGDPVWMLSVTTPSLMLQGLPMTTEGVLNVIQAGLDARKEMSAE